MRNHFLEKQLGMGAERRAVLKGLAALGIVPITVPLTAGTAHAAEDLLVFDWTGYEVPELHQPYIDKYGASPPITMYGDLEEAFQKLRAGFKPDIVHPGTWEIRRYRDAGLIDAWDTARLRHWPDVLPELANLDVMQDSYGQWMIPCDWGINSILYRTDLVDIDIEEESWTFLWDERYAGRIANIQEMEAAVLGAALAFGVSDPFNPSDAEKQTIRDALVSQRELLRFYWTSPTEMEQALVSGEIVAAYAWPASYATMKAEGHAVRYMEPKEGVFSWLGGWLLLKDRPGNEQNIYDFVDAWLDPGVGKWMMENYGYGHSNRVAFEIADAAKLADLGLSTPAATLGNSLFMKEMDPQLREEYVRMFEEVQAGF